jgi:hypothetical protein
VADLLYHLNATDEISCVNEAWTTFAEANRGGTLKPSEILGRSLWEFVGDIDTRHIYRIMHERVRTRRAPVQLRFRCDAPELRRLLELSISPGDDEGLTYRVRTVKQQDRAPVSLLDPLRSRSEGFVTMCGWCKRVAVPPRDWLEVEDAILALQLFAEPHPPQLTHGICGECKKRLDDQLRSNAAHLILGRL